MRINSLEYFNSQIAESYQQMGFKPFWEHPKKPQLLKTAIVHQYLELKLSPEEDKKAVFSFQTFMMEFTKRCLLLNIELF